MSETNTQILMRQRPQGMVSESDFETVQRPLPTLAEGQALVRNQFLSLDPYVRPRMDAQRSYVEPLQPGELLPGATIGEVIESRSRELPVGTRVAASLGWQSHGVVAHGAVRVIDKSINPPSAALSVLGMTGVTAHYGLLKLIQPKAGETVLVSAAAGAVGGVVGQIAKIKGCRVVGIAGGPEKCAYAVEQLGYDACIDYRAPDFEKQLAAATPDYVNAIFENVGGPIFDAALKRMADFARIALCGNISQYNEREPYGLKGVNHLLLQRATLYGFVIADQRDYFPAALGELGTWLREGKLSLKEDVSKGLESAPAAFIRMLTGKNFGKQIVAL